ILRALVRSQTLPVRLWSADGRDIKSIDVPIPQKGETQTLKRILEERIINKIKARTIADIRRDPLEGARSVLLFGPPGTSKTVLVRELAKKVKWPLIEIYPSHFLKEGGLVGIHYQANNIFNDLMDLARVIVLFDEMDSLVLTREQDKAVLMDTTSRFLTTDTLPKLATLHDHGQVVFFMATNYREVIDPAIKRSGRFDLKLCVGPPSWQNKLNKLEEFFDKDHSTTDIKRAKATLKKWTTGNDDLETKLNKFTYGEMKAFLSNLRQGDPLASVLSNLGKAGFAGWVDKWHDSISLADSKVKDSYEREKRLSSLQI
ncbi:MAG: ATP-binding protein, partial [Candidatus Hodarchaeota archaeon]